MPGKSPLSLPVNQKTRRPYRPRQIQTARPHDLGRRGGPFGISPSLQPWPPRDRSRRPERFASFPADRPGAGGVAGRRPAPVASVLPSGAKVWPSYGGRLWPTQGIPYICNPASVSGSNGPFHKAVWPCTIWPPAPWPYTDSWFKISAKYKHGFLYGGLPRLRLPFYGFRRLFQSERLQFQPDF